MPETKFTPRPWVRSSHGFQVLTLREHEKYGLVAWECVCEIRRPGEEEQKATAALIASAPDLYHALDSLIYRVEKSTQLTMSCEDDCICEICAGKAILSKARGEAPNA